MRLFQRVTLCLAAMALAVVMACIGVLVWVGEWLVELMAEVSGGGT